MDRRAGEGSLKGVVERRTQRRRRFASWLAPVAVVLIAIGGLLGGRGGFVSVVGLLCLAYGLGFGVTAIFLASGQNPLDRRGAPR